MIIATDEANTMFSPFFFSCPLPGSNVNGLASVHVEELCSGYLWVMYISISFAADLHALGV